LNNGHSFMKKLRFQCTGSTASPAASLHASLANGKISACRSVTSGA